MSVNSEVAVTLSAELLAHLRKEARLLGVPLEYLVASLVVDTFEETPVETPRTPDAELIGCC